ncbi:histidine utilization repressor [Craterilacuibacter sinensis]|uniref:Histidine utilization repressor n=1 Tax=Craterilacuibacter sinensis TaxID=2686017 RepID=A0A845BNL3_9NEIS|nr:histidine utilization repressor [Craterilacuibacter sinensis]MXR35886.1 histidine utilization repressor [Craterilacuibacter sinensis]RQW27124.1 histidine utilization repressor [Rhodobacteraceae bacterium CH30]
MDIAVNQTAKPRFQCIKEHILDGIHRQLYLPGCKIPSELDLARDFAVSRMTVNKALRELSDEGVLLRFAGDGTYVAENKVAAPLLDVNNIRQEIHTRGHHYVADVVSLCALKADQETAQYLEVEPGTRLYYSLIVHREDGLAVQLEERFVHPHWVPDYLAQDFSSETPNSYLRRSASLTEIEHAISAVMPGLREQSLLALNANEPCLLVQRHSHSHKNLVSFTRLWHPGHRYSLHSRVLLDS